MLRITQNPLISTKYYKFFRQHKRQGTHPTTESENSKLKFLNNKLTILYQNMRGVEKSWKVKSPTGFFTHKLFFIYYNLVSIWALNLGTYTLV